MVGSKNSVPHREPRRHHREGLVEAVRRALSQIRLPATETRVLKYVIRCPQGVSDDSIAVDLNLVVGTANRARTTLCELGFLDYTGRRTTTSSGGSARVYELSDPAVTRRVPNVTLSIEKKDAAFSRLIDVFDFVESRGCHVPDELLPLAKWLQSKLLLDERRRAKER